MAHYAVVESNGYIDQQLNLSKRAYVPKMIDLEPRGNNHWKRKVYDGLLRPRAFKIWGLRAVCPEGVEISRVLITMCGEIFVDIPRSILELMTKGTYQDGSKFWSLSHDSLFSDRLPLHYYYDSVVEVYFTGEVSSAGVLVEYTYLSQKLTRELENTDRSNVTFQVIHSCTVMNTPKKHNMIIELNAGMLTKGLFLEADNIQSLSNLSLRLNKETLLDLQNSFLFHYCRLMNHRMLWVPFKRDVEIWDSTPKSYDGSVNLGRIDKVLLNLTFTSVSDTLTIYPLSLNFIRVNNGWPRGQGLIDNFSCILVE